jgi:peroxiredoxin
MAKIELNTPAPDFSLPDFEGRMFSLSGLHGQSHAVLIFNRGFF